MAQILTALGTPKRITLTNADQAEQITLPASTRLVTLNFIDNAGKYSNSGTQGAALTDYITVPTNQLVEKKVNKDEQGSLPVIFVESAVGATVVEILPEARQ